MKRVPAFVVAAVVAGMLAPASSVAQPAPVTEYTGPSAGVVRLPWSDFRELIDQLRTLQEPEEAPPPTPSVIGSSVYRVTVDADERQAKVDAEIELVVLQRQGWVDVPLLPDSAALESFAMDGRPATLTQRDGYHRLIAQAGLIYYGAPTARKVTMTYRVNVERDGGPHGFRLPTVEAGITRLELALPRTDQDVRVEPGGVVLDRVSSDAGTTIVALVPRTTAVNVRWSDRAAPVLEEPVRAVADVVHRLAFQRHVVSGEVTVSLSIERGSFEAVVLHFPKEAEGIRATGDFSVDVAPEGDAAQVAVVHAGYPRREATVLVVRYEMARSVGQLGVPDVKVVKLIQAGQDREIVRQAGFLVLYADEGMEVKPEGAPTGAEPCDVSEVPGATELTGQPVTAYRTSGQPYTVPVTVTRHEERAVLASAAQYAQLDLVVNREGKAVGDLVLSVQNNERQFLGVWLPRQAQLWATFVRGMPVKPSGEKEWVMIPVPRSTIGPDGIPETIPVEVIYYQDVPRIEGLWGDGTFDIPRVDLLVSSYAVSVWAPEEFRYFGFEGDAKPDEESVGPAGWAFDTLTDQTIAEHRPEVQAVFASPMTTEPGYRDANEQSLHEDKAREISDEEEGGTGARAAGDEGKMGRREAEDVDRMAGVQGPREATAKIDDSLSMENILGGEQAGESRYGAVASSSRGLLPIRVSVARTGLLLRFTRSLVEPKDGTVIEFRYQGKPVLRTFPWLRGLAGLLLALGLARVAHRSIGRRRFSVGAIAPVSLALGLALAVVLGVVLRAPIGGVFWALTAGVVIYGAIVAGVLLWRYWKEHRPFETPDPPSSSEPSVPPTPPAPEASASAGPAAPEVRS